MIRAALHFLKNAALFALALLLALHTLSNWWLG